MLEKISLTIIAEAYETKFTKSKTTQNISHPLILFSVTKKLLILSVYHKNAHKVALHRLFNPNSL